MLPGEPDCWSYAGRRQTEGPRYSPSRGCGNRRGSHLRASLSSLDVKAVDWTDDEAPEDAKEYLLRP